jgi:hypothetical protein
MEISSLKKEAKGIVELQAERKTGKKVNLPRKDFNDEKI